MNAPRNKREYAACRWPARSFVAVVAGCYAVGVLVSVNGRCWRLTMGAQ